MKISCYCYILLFGSLGILCGSCGDDQKRKGQLPSLPVVEVTQRTVNDSTVYPAKIEGVMNIEIRPKIEGYVEKIHVGEGDRVKKGDLLFTLEARSLDAEAQAANDAITVAKANVDQAEVEVEKLRPLVEQEIISEARLKTAKANLLGAESELEQARNQYQSVQQNFDYRSIRSPVDGIVNRLPSRLGSLVAGTDETPLTTVSNVEDVYAYFAMNEKDFVSFLTQTDGDSLLAKLDNFPQVVLALADGTNYEYPGIIETTTGAVDPETGTIGFRALFPNPERILRNGYSGTVKIPREFDSVIVVPAQSTYREQTLTYIFKLTKGDTLRNQPIEVREQVRNMLVVASGLKVGDTIGTNNVRPGTKIQPRPVPLDSVLGSIEQVFKN